MHDKLGSIGLSKREQFALEIFSSLLIEDRIAWYQDPTTYGNSDSSIIDKAVKLSGDLLEALEYAEFESQAIDKALAEMPDPESVALDELRSEYYRGNETLLVEVSDA